MIRKSNTALFGILVTASFAPSVLAQTPTGAEGQTIINGRILTEAQKLAFQMAYGSRPLSGSFWYDARSGMFGYWGHEVAGLIVPGLELGPLSPDASKGNTAVFINGRQLNVTQLMFFQQLAGGTIQPGRAWIDGRTWNYGLEGSPIPLGNMAQVVAAVLGKPTTPRKPLYTINELLGGSSNSAGTCTAAGNCAYSNR